MYFKPISEAKDKGEARLNFPLRFFVHMESFTVATRRKNSLLEKKDLIKIISSQK